MNSALLFAAGGLTAFDGSLVSTSVVLVFALLVACASSSCWKASCLTC